MSRYATYGALDNRIDKEGDVGFVGFNNRMRPDQLKSGMLADAQNIRTDRNGQAQVRKGVSLVSDPIITGADALTLPFTLVADQTVTATPNVSNNLIITSVTATDFPSSGTINLTNTSGISPDPDGNRPYTKTSNTELKISDQSYSGSADTSVTLKFGILNDTAINEIFGSADFSDPNDDSSQYIIIAANTKASGIDIANNVIFDMGFPAGVTISSSADMLQAFNKMFIFRNGQTALENKLRISRISDAAVSSSTNKVTITTTANHNLKTGDIVTVTGVVGSGTDGAFTSVDPNETAKTITKTGDTTFTYDLTSGSNETYVVSNSSIVATDFTKVSSGEFTQPSSIFSTAGDFSIINSVGSLHTSETLLVGNELTLTDDGATSCGLTVPFDFLINEVFSSGAAATVNAVSISGTRVTVGTDGSHGLTLNQPITFAGLDSGLNGNNSVAKVNSATEFEVEVATTFTVSDTTGTATPAAGVSFVIPSDSITSKKTQAQARASNPVFIKRVSVSLGFIHMPAPPFAVYHQRRLVMPFRFLPSSTADTFTNRNTLDEVVASDILDSDTYDRVFAQYRFNAGTSDFVVGLHSFAEDRLMVFNRNSIHLVANTTNLKNASTKLLTDEVGCLARKSIQQVGNQVIFLSDNGVYGTQFLDEYNLRGTETPLSEPINETFTLVNKDLRSNSIAVYFDNRYYLALPLNSIDENNQEVTATANNAIIIYNFLNNQWESVDRVNNQNFHISNMMVAGEGENRGVYVVNNLGGIHRLDHNEEGKDVVITQVGGSQELIDIAGLIKTRQYTVQSLERKRWREFDLHVQSSDTNTSNFDIDFETENPDKIDTLGSLSSFNDGVLAIDEDVSIRGRIGNRRGYGIQFTFKNTIGRPIIRAIEVEGSTTMRSTNKAI
jgi:hypothetical protein